MWAAVVAALIHDAYNPHAVLLNLPSGDAEQPLQNGGLCVIICTCVSERGLAVLGRVTGQIDLLATTPAAAASEV